MVQGMMYGLKAETPTLNLQKSSQYFFTTSRYEACIFPVDILNKMIVSSPHSIF